MSASINSHQKQLSFVNSFIVSLGSGAEKWEVEISWIWDWQDKQIYFLFSIFLFFLVAQLCRTLCDPVDCSPPGSSIHEILQARILEWVAMPSSRISSRPRNQTQVSCYRCFAGLFFTCWAIRETLIWKFSSVQFVSDSLRPHGL